MLVQNTFVQDSAQPSADAQASDGSHAGRQSRQRSPLLPALQPVRIGRMAENGEVMPQRLASAPAATTDAALQAVVSEFEDLRHDAAKTTSNVALLAGKIDAMKDAVDLLEAHMSVGLARSIAGMIRTEVAAVEEQLAARNRYRTRYRVALVTAAGLAAAIGIDRYHAFLDRAFDLIRL